MNIVKNVFLFATAKTPAFSGKIRIKQPRDLSCKHRQKYGLNENWLRRIFAAYMLYEGRLQPPVEPTGFLKFVPILKSVDIDNMTYAVTHMKQYSNASVVYVETEIKLLTK